MFPKIVRAPVQWHKPTAPEQHTRLSKSRSSRLPSRSSRPDAQTGSQHIELPRTDYTVGTPSLCHLLLNIQGVFMNTMRKFLRLPAVNEATGWSRATIWGKVKAGILPAPIPIGPKSVAWDATEIAQ